MENYNIFKLYVVNYDGIYYICEKVNENYIDIFFNEGIENKEDIKYLASYYMVETMKKLAGGEEFILTKKELLKKFALINASNLRKNIEQSHPYDFIKYQEEYLKNFKELSEKRPDIAKQIAEESIKRLNLRYED